MAVHFTSFETSCIYMGIEKHGREAFVVIKNDTYFRPFLLLKSPVAMAHRVQYDEGTIGLVRDGFVNPPPPSVPGSRWKSSEVAALYLGLEEYFWDRENLEAVKANERYSVFLEGRTIAAMYSKLRSDEAKVTRRFFQDEYHRLMQEAEAGGQAAVGGHAAAANIQNDAAVLDQLNEQVDLIRETQVGFMAEFHVLVDHIHENGNDTRLQLQYIRNRLDNQ